MKITFVYVDRLPHRKFWKGVYYGGIGSLSALLKGHGHNTSLVHITQPTDKTTFIGALRDASPDLIGFSATSHAFPDVKILARWIKEENVHVHTICGGIHPTLCPEETIDTPGIDMICRGEGEEPLLELCDNLQKGGNIQNIQNIWYKENGSIYRNPLRPLRQNLDCLPFPDRDIFNYKELYHESHGYATVMVSRGCPYQCSYCSNHALRRLYGPAGNYVRFRSVENAISEIKQIVLRYPFVKAIHFDDDILFLNEGWTDAFLSKYKAEVGLPFRCNERPNLVDAKKVELLRKAGCSQVTIGLESGNDYIRNEVLKRHLTRGQITEAFRLFKQAKIRIKSFNMVGLPFEDARAVLDTIKLNAEMGVDDVQATIFQPYPGTRLFDLCAEKGFLTHKDLTPDFFSLSPLALDSIAPGQILMFRDYFRVIAGLYRVLHRLGNLLSRPLIKLSDAVLCFSWTSKLLNAMYVPINFLYRLIRRAR